jgi:hypothetical protein
VHVRDVGGIAPHKKSGAPSGAPDYLSGAEGDAAPRRYATLGVRLRELRWKNSA